MIVRRVDCCGPTKRPPRDAVRSRPRGVRIDVDELSRRVRVRKRGELTLLDAVSFTLVGG